jgi:REP element-mobilizing transposase RayT
MTEKIKDAIYTKRYVYNCHYHLIWCTKYRNQIFTTAELASEMKELIIETAASNDIQIEKLEVMPEHVHAMISFRPSKSISAAVKALKGHSSQRPYRIRIFARPPRHTEKQVLGRQLMVIQLLHRNRWQYVKGYSRKIYQRSDIQCKERRQALSIHPLK